MKIIYFISFIAVLNFFSACNLFIQNQTPEILTAEYKLKSYNDTERGFEVFLVIKNIRPEHKIKSIVLKKHRFDGINTHEMMKNQVRSEEHTSELQSRGHLVCRLLLEKKKTRLKEKNKKHSQHIELESHY